MSTRGEVTRLRKVATPATEPSAATIPAQGGPVETNLAARFVAALVAQDREALLELLAPAVRMRGMAPGRSWESHSAEELVDDILLGDFFGPSVTIEEVTWSRFGTVVDKNSASYYLRMLQDGKPIECEQHCFFDVEGGLIYGLHLACSGFTPSRPA